MFYILVLPNIPLVRDYIYTEEIIRNVQSTRTIIVKKRKTKVMKNKYYFSNVSIMKQIMH